MITASWSCVALLLWSLQIDGRPHLELVVFLLSDLHLLDLLRLLRLSALLYVFLYVCTFLETLLQPRWNRPNLRHLFALSPALFLQLHRANTRSLEKFGI